jgi:hypothetical protein
MSSTAEVFAAFDHLQTVLDGVGEKWESKRAAFLAESGPLRWSGSVPDLKALVQGSLLWMADGSTAWIRTTQGAHASRLRLCTLGTPQGVLHTVEELTPLVSFAAAGILVDTHGKGARSGEITVAGRPMTVAVSTVAAAIGGQPLFAVSDERGSMSVEVAVVDAMCGASLGKAPFFEASVRDQPWVRESRVVEESELAPSTGPEQEAPFSDGSIANLYHQFELLDENNCIPSAAFAAVWATVGGQAEQASPSRAGLHFLASVIHTDDAAAADMETLSEAVSGLLVALGPILLPAFIREVIEMVEGPTAVAAAGRSRSVMLGLGFRTAVKHYEQWVARAEAAAQGAAQLHSDTSAARVVAAQTLRDLQSDQLGPEALDGSQALLTPATGVGNAGAEGHQQRHRQGDQSAVNGGDPVQQLLELTRSLAGAATPQGDVAALRREISTLATQVAAVVRVQQQAGIPPLEVRDSQPGRVGGGILAPNAR